MPAHPPVPSRITLPAPPLEPGRREFPLLATAAPVVGSLVIWAVTGSPFALVFAFLGPVIAVGSMIDARRHGRRSARTEARRFDSDIEAVLGRIEAAHLVERQSLLAQALHPHDLLGRTARDPEWWRQGWNAEIFVCVGIGEVPSTLEVETPAAGAPPDAEAAHARVVAAASALSAAPVFIDARHGIGIIGPPRLSAALARSIVAQLAFQLSPAEATVAADAGGHFGWALRLPHPSASTPVPGWAEFAPIGDGRARPELRVVCVVAGTADEVPRDCRVLIRLDRSGNAVVERNPSGSALGRFRPWFLSEVQAEGLAGLASSWAAADGLTRMADPLPELVELFELRQEEPPTGGLAASFCVGASGAVTVDLARDGPHAVLGGTTGSGKSELLVSWVLALAAAYPPAEVNFLLVDFKGGSSFAAVSRLPHTVGLITDLDHASARRALLSLEAELRHRERVLAAAGARTLGELTDRDRMPRLVILVDEFAVVVSEFPELQPLFADLAGRGRSLGIHLVLCTQRPAGVIRDSVLANCSLRMSLRVNNPADSAAVIGSPAAAELPVQVLGRCLLSVAGADPVPVQVAIASPADTDRVIEQYRPVPYEVRRPWQDPLPRVVSLADAGSRCSEAGLPFGLADLPEAQSQPAAVYHPRRDGNLVVFGGLGSGKTATLATLQAASELRAGSELQAGRAVTIPSGVEGAWDAVAAAVARLASPTAEEALLLLDDVDALVARFSVDHQLEFVELLSRLLREGPGRGSRTVLSAARLTSSIQSLVSLCDSRLILRMPNRQDHLLAGGDGERFDANAWPGAGTWRGHPVQVALAEASEPPESELPVSAVSTTRQPLEEATGFAVVTPGARAIAERMRVHPDAPPWLDVVDVAEHRGGSGAVSVQAGSQVQVLVGDVAAWQAQWSLFAAARANGPVVFAGCSVAEFRALTGTRQLPPPIGPKRGGGWLLGAEGSTARLQVPEWLLGTPR